MPTKRRPSRKKAEAAVAEFLFDLFEVKVDVRDFTLFEDGDDGWAFYIRSSDTTSYVHPDLSIEWYGTLAEPPFDQDEPVGVAA